MHCRRIPVRRTGHLNPVRASDFSLSTRFPPNNLSGKPDRYGTYQYRNTPWATRRSVRVRSREELGDKRGKYEARGMTREEDHYNRKSPDQILPARASLILLRR